MSDNTGAGDAPEDSTILTTFIAQVMILKKQIRRVRFIESIAAVLIVAAIVLLSVGLANFADQANQNKNAGITQCENGNTFRTEQTQTWQDFFALQSQENQATATLLTQLISTLARSDPAEIAQINAILAQSGKADSVLQKAFLDKVKSIDTLHNCQALFNAQAGGNP